MLTIDTARRCPLQFPKWFGCALANHEGLAGGLIGAGGALFAGWLAWNAALRQIAAGQLPSLFEAQGRTFRQINALSYARDYVSTIVDRFAAIPVEDKSALVAELQEIHAEGGLAQPLMPQATREVGLRIEHIMRSLREVASHAGTPHLPVDPAAKVMSARLRELRQVRAEIEYSLTLARAQAADLVRKIGAGGGEVLSFEPVPRTQLENRTSEAPPAS